MILKSVIVPDVRNKKIGEAGKILADAGLRHTTEYLELTNESVIIDQYPLPGLAVKKESIVDLFIDFKAKKEMIMPFLTGKNEDETVDILEEMNLKYELKGNGKVESQSPQPGEEVDSQTEVIVEFK